MKTKIISARELKECIEKDTYVYASSYRECKRIELDHKGNIYVYAHHKLIYKGISTTHATRAYNNVTQKYVDPLHDVKLNFKL